MIERPDMVHPFAAKGVEVLQLTDCPDSFYTHVYMEAQIFLPDSRRFLLQKGDGPHDVLPTNPDHQYLLCDIENGFELTPLITELGCLGPSITPDGQWVYYFLDRTVPSSGWIELKRVRPDGTEKQTITRIDKPFGGLYTFPTRLYPLSSISSDGKKIAMSCFFGDGVTEEAPWGLMVFETSTGKAEMIIHGHTWCNIHPQYSRSSEHGCIRDILVQENHGYATTATGDWIGQTRDVGADIHVIKDDGSDLRDFPWGRNGKEYCQGHQCWRGRSRWAITSTVVDGTDICELVESLALPHLGHIGLNRGDGVRNLLTRELERPAFYHFATDRDGTCFVSDSRKDGHWDTIYLAELGEPGTDPLKNTRPLAESRCSDSEGHHPHPFLSPDGKMAFFNSDESGRLQTYAIRGFV